MKKVSMFLVFPFLVSGASIVLAGGNGGQADRYNEARSYPDKSIDERLTEYRSEESETLEVLKEEHKLIKKLIEDLLEKR